MAKGLDRGQNTQDLEDHTKNFLYPKNNWFQTEISESTSVGLFDSNRSKENRLRKDKEYVVRVYYYCTRLGEK